MSKIKKFDIFDVRSTSDESKEIINIGEMSNSIVEWQAIIGRLYANAARFRNVTNKHAAWKKAAKVRAKVNEALRELRNA